MQTPETITQVQKQIEAATTTQLQSKLVQVQGSMKLAPGNTQDDMSMMVTMLEAEIAKR